MMTEQQQSYKEALLKGVSFGLQTVESLAQKKQDIEERYAGNPDKLATSLTYAPVCEVLAILQAQQCRKV